MNARGMPGTGPVRLTSNVESGSLLNAPPRPPGARMQEVKKRIHRQLLERLNLSNLDGRTREDAASLIRPEIQALLVTESEALNLDERDNLVRQILDEIFGLGP